MTATITSPTEPQIAQVKMYVEHAVRKSGVDSEGLQLLLGRGGEFQNGIIPLIHRLSRKEENPFSDEKEGQNSYYPVGWSVPALSVQAERLAAAFPGLDVTFQNPSSEPTGDGFALIPKLSAITRITNVEDPYGAGYGQLVGYVLDCLSQSRPFVNYRKGQLGSNYIRIEAETRALLEKLEAETPGDCLVLPVSFDNNYGGFSTRNARWEALHSHQLPLGAVQVGSLLIAMPDRLTHYADLWIDCPGDEYDWDADGKWTYCPYFRFGDGRLEFAADWADAAYDDCGSAVAFLGVPV